MQTEQLWWRWNDIEHMNAHRDDFTVPPEEILEHLSEEIAGAETVQDPAQDPEKRWVHTDFPFLREVGLSGLRSVAPDGSESWWGYRRGRVIPSHLCGGSKEPVRRVCIWGWWEIAAESENVFVVHTMYPGWAAPREIHDPDLASSDLPRAIEFWRSHAIIVRKGEWFGHAAPHGRQ